MKKNKNQYNYNLGASSYVPKNKTSYNQQFQNDVNVIYLVLFLIFFIF